MSDITEVLVDLIEDGLPEGAYMDIMVGGCDQRTFDTFGESEIEELPCANPECECLTAWKSFEDGSIRVMVGLPLRKRHPS